MTRVLVVTAVDLEARGLARHLGLSRVEGPEWPHYRGGALDLVCAGPRAAHLDARAASIESVALVVSAGVCGALSPDLAPIGCDHRRPFLGGTVADVRRRYPWAGGGDLCFPNPHPHPLG